MKMPVCKIFAYKHFFVKTVIWVSSSVVVNHLIRKELYQKQNGFKFMKFWLHCMKIDFHCREDTSFIHMTQY